MGWMLGPEPLRAVVTVQYTWPDVVDAYATIHLYRGNDIIATVKLMRVASRGVIMAHWVVRDNEAWDMSWRDTIALMDAIASVVNSIRDIEAAAGFVAVALGATVVETRVIVGRGSDDSDDRDP